MSVSKSEREIEVSVGIREWEITTVSTRIQRAMCWPKSLSSLAEV